MLSSRSFFFRLLTAWTIIIGTRAALLFPANTVFQFTIGVSVPVAMETIGSVSFNFGYQFNFVLPWNTSQLKPTVLPSRGIGNFNLESVYENLKDLLDKRGWQRSGECLLRTICEFAEIPFDRDETTEEDHKRDILEEIIHLLLTPSEDLPEAVNSSHRSVNKLYQEAERLGRSGGDCILTYPDCIESPLRSFTEIVFP